jgi:hypothetical protein
LLPEDKSTVTEAPELILAEVTKVTTEPEDVVVVAGYVFPPDLTVKPVTPVAGEREPLTPAILIVIVSPSVANVAEETVKLAEAKTLFEKSPKEKISNTRVKQRLENTPPLFFSNLD